MRNGLRISPVGYPIELLEGRTLLSDTGPVATVITPPAYITAPGSAGTSIVVQYTDPAGINLSSISGSNLTIGVGSFAPSAPPVPVTVSSITHSTDSTTATVTYDLGSPYGAFYSQDDDIYRVELNADSVLDNAGVAAAGNPLLGLYQVQINPVDASFSGGSLGFATSASLTQPDGKLLLAGSQNPSAPQAVIERLNADGTPDTTFASTGGIATTPGDNDSFQAIGLQSTGEIVVAGSANGDLLLSRYSPTGANDSETTTPIDFGSGITASFYGLAVAPDDTIYAVGSESTGAAVVAHYSADGSLDTSFGTDGIATFTVGSATATSLSSVAFADNELIVAGSADSNVFVAELSSAGSFAPSFNSGSPDIVAGLAAGAGNPHSPALAVAADGDIYLASHVATGDLAIERLTPAGQPDSVFGSAGTATTHFGPSGTAETDDADSILLRSDGTIVVSGTSDGQSVLAVYNSNGSPFSPFTKDAFSATSDPTVTTDQAVATLSGENAVVLSTTGNTTVTDEFDIAAAPTTTPPTNPTPPVSPSPPITPPVTTVPPTPLGTLGKVNGKRISHLTFTAPGGASVTLHLAGSGTAEALQNGQEINLVITGSGLRLSASSSAAFTLGNVVITGSLAQFKAPTAALAGTLSCNGRLGAIALGSVTGTIASASQIASLDAASLSGATVVAGANLGSAGVITGGDATFGPGAIDSIRISGAISDSTIAAGVSPGADGVYGTSDDQFLTGVIKRLTAASANSASHFEAAAFGVIKLPGKVDPATDQRFQM